MKFENYFSIIKSNVIKKISNDDLCRLLFDSIITPLDLMNKNGDVLDYEKGRISEFINGKRPVPDQIRDNIYDPKVSSTIVKYFDNNVIKLLTPNREDICFQIMCLVDQDKYISPASKANLRMLSQPSTIAALLAQTFCYAVRGDNGLSVEMDSTKTTKSTLRLVGIHGNKCSDNVVIDSFYPQGYLTTEQRLQRIDNLYVEISSIHIGNSKDYKLDGWISSFQKEPVKISEDKKKVFIETADARKIVLPDDFFELGDLVRNPFKTMDTIMGGTDLEGSEAAFTKYKLFHKLEDEIYDALDWCALESQFCEYRCIKLAIQNSGSCADQNITVTMRVPKGAFVSVDDLLELDNTVLNKLLTDFDGNKVFGICSTSSYLDYESSRNAHNGFINNGITKRILYGQSERNSEEFKRDFSSIFDYAVYYEDDMQIITLEYDEILHNTTVAFPTVLLLNKDIEKIDYSIRSRQMSDIYYGTIKTIKG